MSFPRITFLLGILILLMTSSCRRCIEGCEYGVCIKGICECDVWYAGDACDRSSQFDLQGKFSGEVLTDTIADPIEFYLLLKGDDPSVFISQDLGFHLQFVNNTRFEIVDDIGGFWTYEGDGEFIIDGVTMNIRMTAQDTFQSQTIYARRLD